MIPRIPSKALLTIWPSYQQLNKPQNIRTVPNLSAIFTDLFVNAPLNENFIAKRADRYKEAVKYKMQFLKNSTGFIEGTNSAIA